MLTSDDIRKAAQKFYDSQEFQCGWEIGAGWANEKNEMELAALRARITELENSNAYLHEVMERAESEANLQISELRAVNSEQADKIVDLQNRRDEHLRTIAELMGEKAELMAALELCHRQLISAERTISPMFQEGEPPNWTATVQAAELLKKHTAQ